MGGIDTGKDVLQPQPRRGSLTEVLTTGKLRKVEQGKKTAKGAQLFEESPAAASLDEAFERIRAEKAAKKERAKKSGELGDSAGETG